MKPQDSQQHQNPSNAAQNAHPGANGQPVPSGHVVHEPEQYVYVTRPHEPLQPKLSDEQRRRYEESKRKYPHLNLSEGEFVISEIDRHPVGLVQIWGLFAIVEAMIFGGVFFLAGEGGQVSSTSEALPIEILAIPAFLLTLLGLIFTFIAHSIYVANKFFLTNESVIQQIQVSLFSKHEQTVSLANIEDASYAQDGLLPHLLNYGLIRLSTEGDETTYRFKYASRPKKHIATLNNAVEAYKNGRPVNVEED